MLAFKNFGHNLKHAVQEFESKFLQKTGNSWRTFQADCQSFAKQDGFYQTVEAELAMHELEWPCAPCGIIQPPPRVSPSSSLSSSLPPLQGAGALRGHGQHAASVLGKLSVAQIKNGQRVLSALQDEIESGNRVEELMRLSSEYYSLIPTT